MSIKRSTEYIENETSSIENYADSIRDTIKEVEFEGKDEVLGLLDNIEASGEDIDNHCSDIRDSADDLDDRINQLEEDFTNNEPNMATMTGHITYKTDNQVDEGIMEVFYECISNIQPTILIDLLKSNLAHSLENKIKEHKAEDRVVLKRA